MPRVVPSQVVALIDQMFPFIKTHEGRHHEFGLDIGALAKVAALVNLIHEVPSHLITVEGDVYGGFVAGLAALQASIPAWQSGNRYHFVSVLPGCGDLHAVALIRRAMAQCPDEAPSAGTATLAFISDNDLRESIQLDISAANTDLRDGNWKGATVLAGSAVETLLLWTLQQHEQQQPGSLAAVATARVAAGKLEQQPHPNPERWTLQEYIETAEGLHLIEPETATQARQAKDFRNLIHPGRSARLGQKCDRATALAALAAVEFVVRDLTP